MKYNLLKFIGKEGEKFSKKLELTGYYTNGGKMKKCCITLLLMFGLFGISLSSAQAASKTDFFVSASIPAASSVSFNVSEVDAGPPIKFTPIATTNLNFKMSLNSKLGIYLPATFFAIDVAPTGGAGTPDVLVDYVDTNNPNAAIGKNGLAKKGVASVAIVTGGPTPADQKETTLLNKTLGDINGTTVTSAKISGGFMRLYLGIVTGDPATTPSGGEVFTNSDNPGSYEGTLTLTATLP